MMVYVTMLIHVYGDDVMMLMEQCDVCNGPGAVYDCGCTNDTSGDCDCNGNVLDALGVCGDHVH